MQTEDKPQLPDTPCACADAHYGDPCVCSQDERALRNYCNGADIPPMTAEQREFCLSEIGSVEGYNRADFEGEDDRTLAHATMSAWRDYARDKGFPV